MIDTLAIVIMLSSQHYCVARAQGGWLCSDEPQDSQPLPTRPVKVADARPFMAPRLSPLQPKVQVDLLLPPAWLAIWEVQPAFAMVKAGNGARQNNRPAKRNAEQLAEGTSYKSQQSSAPLPTPGYYLQLGAYDSRASLAAVQRTWQSRYKLSSAQFWRQPHNQLKRLLVGPFNRERAEKLQERSRQDTWLRYLDATAAQALELPSS